MTDWNELVGKTVEFRGGVWLARGTVESVEDDYVTFEEKEDVSRFAKSGIAFIRVIEPVDVNVGTITAEECPDKQWLPNPVKIIDEANKRLLEKERDKARADSRCGLVAYRRMQKEYESLKKCIAELKEKFAKLIDETIE